MTARILIVEDNAVFRQSLKDMLCGRFPCVQIEEAQNGKEAMDKVESFSPDVIFMDIRLPGENGLEVTKKIKSSQWPGTIIVLTSYDLEEYREAAFSSGANYFLAKGVASGDEILGLVETITAKTK